MDRVCCWSDIVGRVGRRRQRFRSSVEASRTILSDKLIYNTVPLSTSNLLCCPWNISWCSKMCVWNKSYGLGVLGSRPSPKIGPVLKISSCSY